MKQSTKQIREVADRVCERLLGYGVVIQRYDALSTNSIYLKFDCGLANSLRIGDHQGKQHLSYMFMVDVNHVGKRKVMRDKYTQYVYASSKKEVNKLVDHILVHRKNRMKSTGGQRSYKEQMKRNYLLSKDQKGFWSEAKFIKKEIAQ